MKITLKRSQSLWLAGIFGITSMAMPLSARAQDAAGTAASAAASSSEPARARIVKLMELTGAASIVEQVADATADHMLERVEQTNLNLPAPVRELIRDATLDFVHDAMHDPDGLMPELVDIYARHFTAEEIEGLIAFYESPLGVKLTRTLPQITTEALAAGEEWSRRVDSDLQAAIRDRLRSSIPKAPMLGMSLATMLQYPGTYIFLEHPDTQQFVQFTEAADGGIVMDVPTQALSAAEIVRAAEFFRARGIDASRRSPVTDPETGRKVGTRLSFQALLQARPMTVARFAQRFFAEVWGADDSVELVTRFADADEVSR